MIEGKNASRRHEKKISVAVIDEHPLFRRGIVHTLDESGKFDVVGEGATASDAVCLATILRPDVMLLDMNVPGGGLEAVDAIVAMHSRTSIIMFTVVDDESCIANAFRRGVRGYLLKGSSGQELVDTISSVVRDEHVVSAERVAKQPGRISEGVQKSEVKPTIELTNREGQVLALLQWGLTNKEIAFKLKLTEKTVKYYLTSILKKLQVRNRVEAAMYAQRPADSGRMRCELVVEAPRKDAQILLK